MGPFRLFTVVIKRFKSFFDVNAVTICKALPLTFQQKREQVKVFLYPKI